ncbi:FliH/SctL family protein [Paramicrobacterium agarici]|uniref:Flagellar assembly protein FliH n=1 Tax=Paramicrobacterium agarici TaxID=630514 RepID=A0A2A9DUZ8_9MICO|nr:FliH/SctL family protein [Microbacterium agarici]PFG30607.1 flagellar assembly protein FliH [Microbacterium agarici]TQO23625.1 flagellar assembly protein FliH [Microbacterium agarici]
MSTDNFTPGVFPRITGAATARDVERARARGYAAGHAEGVRAAATVAAEQRARIDAENEANRAEQARSIETALSILEESALALSRRHGELLVAAQSLLERLAVELAEAVVARELSSHEASARNALHRALSVVDADDITAVRLNPLDADILRRLHVDDATTVTLVPDLSLAPGDAVADLDDGAVNAHLSDAFERARSALSEVRP